jgi:Cupin domain
MSAKAIKNIKRPHFAGGTVRTNVARSVAVCALVFGAVVTARADPTAGVTPNLIGRGTYGAFNLQAAPAALAFSAASKGPIDIVVRTHDYAPGSSTGWHSHPGPVFITVLEGKVTFYEKDDPTCTPKVVSKGEGYVDTGGGHIGRNESGAPAKDVTVFFAPVSLPFRGELPAAAPQCKF